MTIARESLVDTPFSSEPPRQAVASWYTPGLSDGFGDRLLMFDNSASGTLELLRFSRALAESPGFEHALRQRLDDLKDFTHDAIGHVRSVQWIGTGEGLALVSDHTPGRRLAETFGETRGQAYAVELVRQLTPLLAALEQRGPGFAHCAINPDRIVIAESGRLVLLEHVLGSAVASLRWPPARLRSALGVAIPGDDPPVLDGRTDVYQLAFLALSVVLGRRVNPSDSASQSERLLAEACRPGLRRTPLSSWFRRWLEQALRIDGAGFRSANEAHLAFHGRPDDQGALPPAPPRELPEHDPQERPLSHYDTPELYAPLQAREVPRPDLAAVAAAEEPLFADEGALFMRQPEPQPPPPGPRLVKSAQWSDKPLIPPPAPPAAAASVAPAPPAPPPVAPSPAPPSGRNWKVAALLALAIVEGVVIGGLLAMRPWAAWRNGLAATQAHAPAVAPAPIVIDSAQPGAQVTIDGKPAGVTPLTVDASLGAHSIRVQAPPAAAAPAGTVAPSAIEVTSDPPGARVTIDGHAAGTTPVVSSVNPGTHDVTVSNGTSTVTRTVRASAGATTNFTAALSSVTGAGWVSISSPVELQVLEGGTIVGTTTAARLMLPVGHHDLTVSNATLGFDAPVRVDIAPGRTATISVPLPSGTISLNALPWANVSIDGREIGTTPIANVELPIGAHEILWRHPQLGDRRQTVTVTTKAPLRLVMDFKK